VSARRQVEPPAPPHKAPWRIVATYTIADIEDARSHRDQIRAGRVEAQMIVAGDSVFVQIRNR
jgi:hypothetical protein